MSTTDLENIGGYPVEKPLHQGSYETVYQVKTSAQPLIAAVLKPELRHDAELAAAVATNWDRCRAVVHQGLLTVYSAAADPSVGAYFLAECVHARTLRKLTLEGAKVAWRDACELAEQMLNALHALHSAGLCHGDMCPTNVLVTLDQDVKLQGAGGLSATPKPLRDFLPPIALSYQPPERVIGDADAPATPTGDLYALGLCLRFLLSGEDPFPGLKAEDAPRVIAERVPTKISVLRPDVPTAAEAFLARLAAKNPAARYADAADAAADLEKIRAGGEPTPPPAPLDEAPPAPARDLFQTAVVKPKPARDSHAVTPPIVDEPSAENIEPVAGGGRAPITPFPGTRVFGRLDTQVGSTIPQSDDERRGDDLYRQGRLPLALNAWKQAWEKGPRHAGLKAKIDLSDRDLRKEIFEAAADECEARIADGQFAVAVERAYTALDAALDETQRAKAQKLLQTAKNEEAQRARKRLLSATFVMVFAIVALGVFVFLTRGGRESPADEENKKNAKTPHVVRTAGKPSFVIVQLDKIGATATLPAAWLEAEIADDELYAWTFEERQSASGVNVKITAHEPEEEEFDVCLKQLSEDPNLPEAKLKGANPNLFKINERHRVAQLEFERSSETDEGELEVHSLFILENPEKKIFRILFSGAKKTMARDDVKKQIVAFFRQFRWREE